MSDVIERAHMRDVPTPEFIAKSKERLKHKEDRSKGVQLYQNLMDVYLDMDLTEHESILLRCFSYYYAWGVMTRSEYGNSNRPYRIDYDEDIKSCADMWAVLLRNIPSGYLQRVCELFKPIDGYRSLNHIKQFLHNRNSIIEQSLQEISNFLEKFEESH